MPEVFGQRLSRDEFLRWVGHPSQVAGVRPVLLQDGRERDVRAFHLWTGSGLEFDVLADRGLDISSARYCGAPLSWRSPVGDAHPAYYEPEGSGWLRTFYGGLVVTCGLTHLGAPCEDEGESLGLHGRYSHIPAANVTWGGQWIGDEYQLWVAGEMREWVMFGANLVLRRRIVAHAGKSEITIIDEVENEGTRASPLMILYHVNLGWPVVAEGAELLSAVSEVRPRDEIAARGYEQWPRVFAPERGFREQVFYLEQSPDSRGYVDVALVNQRFRGGRGLGVALRYAIAELPRFILWKQLDEKTYVVGLEPANCLVEGRARERARGTLQTIEPGEKRHFELEIRVLEGDEIALLRDELEDRRRRGS